MDIRETAEDYQHFMRKENVWGYKKRFDTILSTIQEHCKDINDYRIIDVGCGNGAIVAVPLAERGYKVVGVDFDPISISKAKELASSTNAEFFVGMASDFVDQKFDFVICSEVLEHVHDYQPLINDLKNLVKEDGIVFVTVPNGWGPYEIERLIFERSGLLSFPRYLRNKLKGDKITYTNSTENMDCGHVNFFTFGKITKALMNDFIIKKVFHTTLFSGPVSHIVFKNNESFLKWNSTFVNTLPHFMSSGWYFVCTLKK